MKPVGLTALTSPDPAAPEPMPVQIHRDLLAAIRGGRLVDGARLPSSRAAAVALGVSRTTLSTAYDLLRAEGVLEMRAGAYPRVVTPKVPPNPRRGSAPPISTRGRALAADPRSNSYAAGRGLMSPGVPDEDLFPRDEWASALRRAARRPHRGLAGYDMTHGLPELRQVLADRLAADRGLTTDPHRILIITGTQAALALLAQVMSAPGDVAAIEDPGYLGARAAFGGAGLRVAPVPVDAEGMRVDLVPAEARLIYTTPSNQYPLGCRLSLSRRLALLDHARRHRALILEDDYDSEFLWRGREIAALAAHAADEVAYLGSTAKVLMPALRLGWLLVPDALVEPLRRAQRNLGMLANLHAQVALADLMQSGRYRTHLRRITRAYEARGLALTEAMRGIAGIEVEPPDGGVQLAVRFTGAQDEGRVIAHMAGQGFHPARLSASALHDDGVQDGWQRGLIVGFADASADRIARFRAALIAAL